MLEESKMDKKSLNRSSQTQSKASAVDCKKTELTHRPWLRNNKKREGTTFAPKNEPNRKNVPTQRGRGQIDRRSRTRGNSNVAMGGMENTGIDEDDEPEIGSVFSPGSKKQNLNHLLNFMYPTRSGSDRRDYQSHRQGYNHRNFVPHRHEHDLYLRAYCQFVVKEEEDYKMNMLDPDLPVKWEKIEQIVVRGTGRSECPICLGLPVAARVGPCGHMYCWACILHYVAAHDKQPPPCPVCTAPMNVKDMKPARMLQWQSSIEEVKMRLVRRLRGSTVVEPAPPRGHSKQSAPATLLPLDVIDNAPYAKLFVATKQQIRDILHRERKELQDQILAEIDISEVVFLEEALELLKIKEQKVDIESVKVEDLKISVVEETFGDDTPTVYEKQNISDKKLDWFDVNEEGAACMDVQKDIEGNVIQQNIVQVGSKAQDANISPQDNRAEIKTNLNPDAAEFRSAAENQNEELPLLETTPLSGGVNDDTVLTEIDAENQVKYFYFYQAEDGQQVFLNSLNVRMLNSSWGALVAAPTTIQGRVLHRETMSLTEQSRKHMPHTAHLPLHCSFDIVELDLQAPYVTEHALHCFAEELDRRARARAKQEREERRRERAHRRAMEGPPKPDFSSELMFPPTASSCPILIEPSLPPTSIEQGTPTDTSSPSSSGLSFAKMASTSGTWRVRKSAPAASPTPPPAADEEEAMAPRTLSLSDAIEAAIHATASTKGKKNKKSKQKLLFTTGMQHTP